MIRSKLRLSPEAESLLKTAAELSEGRPLYLVGGAVRDAWLGRETGDLDLACDDPEAFARRLRRPLKGTLVILDEQNAVYRVVPRPTQARVVKQIDVAALQGGGIREDLERRDFTIDAMALEIPGNRLVDPRKGLADLKKRVLRAEREELFTEDPLRLLRAFRIASQLDFSIEKKTLNMVRRQRRLALKPAAERVQSELMLLLQAENSAEWLKSMDDTGLLTSVFEELEPSRRCATVYYGEGGVLKHSLETVARMDFLFARLPKAFPGVHRAASERLAAREESGRSGKAVLRLAALLHDVAKAETAATVGDRLRFFGHDTKGAAMSETILRRLRFSHDRIRTVSRLIAQHLRPGHLAAAEVVTDKAAYRFFRDLGDEALDLLLLSWSDHASYIPANAVAPLLKKAWAQPPGSGLAGMRPASAVKTVRHMQVVSLLLRRLFDAERRALPECLLDGHEVMKTTGLPPGPRVGELLEAVREAQAEGRIQTKEQATEFIKKNAADRS